MIIGIRRQNYTVIMDV